MEYNDLDGFEEAMNLEELREKLTRHYQNATAYAVIKNENLLRKELGKIEKIISGQMQEAEDSWFNFQWAIKDPSVDEDTKQELFLAHPFYKVALKAAEVVARNYRESAAKLLTICQRRAAA